MKKLLARIRMLLRNRKLRRFWTRSVSTVAALVVFVTTYALVLPAITMESEAACGKQAHQHTDSCYEKQLICQLQESDDHHHTDSCYEKVLVCGIEPHIHSPECYKEDSSAVAATGQTSAGARILETAGAESRFSEDAYDSAAESAGASDAAAADPAGVEPESMDDAAVSENGEDPAGGSGADFAEDASGSSESDFSKDTTDGSGTDFAEGPADGSETDIAENPGSEPGTEFAEDTAEGAETDFAEEDFAEGSSDEAGADFAEDSSDEAGADFAEDTSDGTDVDNAGAPADDSSAAGAQDPAQDTAADPSQTTPAAQEDSAAAGTTGVLPEELASTEENLSDGYVPRLEELYFPALLTQGTGFYYYHIGEEDEIPGTSADITEWKKVNDDTQLASTDLVKAWLSYTIPAGALNETNQIAHYRLPANLHLTDDQILAINSAENGIALQADRSTEDGENEYQKYLGAEAIEGTRTPDQDLIEGTQEYISAAVKAENIYENTLDENGNYVTPDGITAPDQGACIGQDLIFIFSPYTIEKNQITYDKNGKPVTKGEAVRGWFAMDFNMEQIDWVEEEKDLDNSTIEKSADVIFAAADEEQKIEEISETLNLTEKDPAIADTESENDKAPENAASGEQNDKADAESQAAFENETADTDDKNGSEEEKTSAPDEETAASEDETKTNDKAESEDAETEFDESDKPLPAENEEDSYKAGSLTAEGNGYKITLDYTENAGIPENAFLSVREITAETDPEAYESCLETARQQVKASEQTEKQKVDDEASRFFDIEILVEKTGEDGSPVQEKIEPSAPVNVNIQLMEAPVPTTAPESAEDNTSAQPADPTVLHFARDGVEQLEATMNTPQPQDGTVSEDNSVSDTPATEIHFEAESFSIYGVVYTVDFEYSVNGKMYQFSLPGGGFVSFTDLVEVLGIIGDTNSDENGSVSAENTEENAANKGTEENSVNSDTNTQLTLGDVEVSEATREFVADVASVEFSSPELVDVSKVENETTVGKIKDSRGLECEYSAELTEEQIAEINVQTVEAGDWALISVQPFTSEETLTATMKDGEVFTIRVTDAQIQKDYISASGETYTITITYSDEAGIPDGADLKVKEIEAGSTEYGKYLTNSAKELGVADSEVSFARFFDIEIVDRNGEKAEPKASVQVKIEYKDSIPTEMDESLSVIHFADDGTEVIEGINLSDDGREITYKQDSFSVTGTITTNAPQNGKYYMLLAEYNGETYMINNDGTLVKVTQGVEADGQSNPNAVSVDYPMLWTYYYQYGGHFRFASEASGFNANQTASGYYYKYLDPNSEDGIIEEHKNGNANNLLSQTVINYYNNSVANSDYSKYIGIVNEGGVLRVTGNADADHAATIKLAEASKVVASDPMKHRVDHIDIGIDGKVTVDVPLAYGKYTYTENGVEKALVVGQNTPSGGAPANTTYAPTYTVELTDKVIEVTSDDMKTADIHAYRKDVYDSLVTQYGKNTPELEAALQGRELPDTFYITGYSANDTTNISEVQVRVEGSFKVADLNYTVGYDYFNWWNPSYANRVKRERLNNQIEYTVSLVKTVTLPVEINGNQVYDDTGNPLTVTVNVPLRDSFAYWDRENECPPVVWDWNNWQSGDIASHGLSGMDFRLDGGTVEMQAESVAINITKFIEDMNGNPIKVSSKVTNSFQVYRDADGNPDSVMTIGSEDVNYSDYAYLHSRDTEIAAGEDHAIIHDWEVTPGMYYVREDSSSIDRTITGQVGSQEAKTYKYKATEILTEYVWRGGDDIGTNSKGILETTHTSSTYTGKNGDSYNAVPDVLGRYTVDNNSTAQSSDGTVHDLYNGFLEFYIINKYEAEEETPPPPSGDTMNIQLEKKWDADGNHDAPTDSESSVTFLLHQVKKTTTGTSGGGGSTGSGEYTVNLYYADETTIASTTSWDGTSAIPISFKNKNPYSPHSNINYYSRYGQYNAGSVQPNGSDAYSGYLTLDSSKADSNKIIKIVFSSDDYSGVDKFYEVPVLGTGGDSNIQSETVVDPDDPYPVSVTLTSLNDWSYTFEGLPTKEINPADNTTIEYSYYLVEDTDASTGAAADYGNPEYVVYSDQARTTQDANDASGQESAITGLGVTKYVDVTNHKTTLTVNKEWRGEADSSAYPPIRFKLYQSWISGNGTADNGWEYTAETNLEKDNEGYYTISADNDWSVNFYNLPATAEHNGTTNSVGYYVKELNESDWHNRIKINYFSSSNPSQIGDENQPDRGGLNGNTGILTIVNTPPKAGQIFLTKKWFETGINQQTGQPTGWSDISESAGKTDNYAFGFITQRQVYVDGNLLVDWQDYGNEIIVKKDAVLKNNNEFEVKYQGSAWKFRAEGDDTFSSTAKNNLIGEGYYQTENGEKHWATYKYRFVETNAYKLDTVWNSSTNALKDEEGWETLPWNPEYVNTDTQTTISNYPIGEVLVTKDWQKEEPDQETGSKVYFKVFQNDGTTVTDITQNIVEHPANYGLKPNQVFSDSEGHYAVVVTYDGTQWETIRIQGLNITEPNKPEYKYSIQEFGYSDKNSTDFWDISKFLQGYVVSASDGANPEAQTNNGGKSAEVSADEPFSLITINNKYIQTETDFTFYKVWKDQFGEIIGWKSPINVQLHQKLADNSAPEVVSNVVEVDPNGLEYETDGSGNLVYYNDNNEVVEEGTEGAHPKAIGPKRIKFTLGGVDYDCDVIGEQEGKLYRITIKGLPYKKRNNLQGDGVKYVYYVTEQTVSGCSDPTFAFAEDISNTISVIDPVTDEETQQTTKTTELHTVIGATYADNAHPYIINQEVGYELPSTGGPGTRPLYILGAMLTAVALALLARRKKA